MTDFENFANELEAVLEKIERKKSVFDKAADVVMGILNNKHVPSEEKLNLEENQLLPTKTPTSKESGKLTPGP
jgi:hypothetical protein